MERECVKEKESVCVIERVRERRGWGWGVGVGVAVRAENEEMRRGATLVKATASHTMFLIAELFEARARAPPL